jgi:ABC-type nitrate/sulfonate/bicarbonate transport system permease component
VGVIVALLLWQLAVRMNEGTLIPSPSAIASSALHNQALLLKGSLHTTGRIVAGLMIGFGFATFLALAARVSRHLQFMLEGPIEVLRPVPPVALTPFFIVLLGLGGSAQISLIALGSFMIFFVGWLEAFRRIPSILLRSAASLGYEGLRRIIHVDVPFSWPTQKPIFRVAIASGLALSVAAEYLGAQGGLGFIIRNARTILDLPLVGAASLLLGVIAVALDRLIVGLIDRTSAWTHVSETSDE